jgi:hypothetical protein
MGCRHGAPYFSYGTSVLLQPAGGPPLSLSGSTPQQQHLATVRASQAWCTNHHHPGPAPYRSIIPACGSPCIFCHDLHCCPPTTNQLMLCACPPSTARPLLQARSTSCSPALITEPPLWLVQVLAPKPPSAISHQQPTCQHQQCDCQQCAAVSVPPGDGCPGTTSQPAAGAAGSCGSSHQHLDS